MVDKMPPHNVQAEISVLGAIMLSNDAIADVIEILGVDDFYSQQHKEIYSVILDLYKRNVTADIVTVCDELNKRKSLDMVGGRGYISSLTADVPSVTNAAEYAKIVSDKASLRRLIVAADNIENKCFEESQDPGDIMDYAEKTIFEIAQNKQKTDFSPISTILETNMDRLDNAVKNRGKVVGLPTGYKQLDSITAGLHKSDLIILAARPAMGKTAFALNIALNAATKYDASVMIFSLEMAKEQLVERLTSIESRVEMEKLKKGNIEPQDWKRISVAYDSLSNAKIFIDDNAGTTILEMKNKCRRVKAEHGLDLVIIDYLQLMTSGTRSDSRQQEIGTISRYLKLLAREIDCPVIVLSQLSREPEKRPDHRPVLSDLRDSGSIEQDADIVMFLYRDDYYNKENSAKPGICEVNIAKHRSGPTDVIDLNWVQRYTKFSDVGKA